MVSLKQLAQYCRDYIDLVSPSLLSRQAKQVIIPQEILDATPLYKRDIATNYDSLTLPLNLEPRLDLLEIDDGTEDDGKQQELSEEDQNKLEIARVLDDIYRKYETSSYTKQVSLRFGRVSFSAQPIVDTAEEETDDQEGYKKRFHIQGKNGSGKTTLLKMIAGLTTFNSGEITLGQNVKYGYFSQEINGLDYNLTNIENLEATGANTTTIYREARSLGLDQSDLRKKPHELSRGQQAKLSFAKLLLGQNQLLILDEPTNHLDIPTREKIEAALKQYSGAILFASHDSYFANGLGVVEILQLTEEALNDSATAGN